ncbi:MAG TPA: hypothetical protein VHM70_00425 [Polyangiaceae bacterium]|jgi:hypothetical protein|nr:hypothetical protein [Polyangiaceae bacterium]
MSNPIFKVSSTAFVLGVMWFAPGRASAKQEFYDAIKSGTDTCLDCRLCHTTPVGTLTSFDLTKPFCKTMYPKYTGGLPPADVDSDGDGFKDLDELKNVGDPNDPMVGPGEAVCPEEVEYGCIGSKPGAGGAETQSSTPAAASSIAGVRARFPAALMALATALVLGRRLFTRQG